MISDSEYVEPDSSTADNEAEEAENPEYEYEDEEGSDDNANETSEVDEYMTDSEEDQREKAKRSQKKQPQRAHEFLLTEAEVGDEESYNENSDDARDIYETEDEEVEALDSQRPTARDIENSRRARDPAILHMEKEQDITEYLRNKYGEQLQAYKDVDEDLADELQQQSFLPGIRDPCLWLVKCQRGKEQETMLQLLQKKLFSGKFYKVFSIVVPPGTPGFIYIEAHKKNHAEEFIQGVSALKFGLWSVKMVPLVEAPDVLRVVSHNGKLKPGSWVRMKRGSYSGDLGCVVSLVDNENLAKVQFVPRIDYRTTKSKTADGQEPVKRKGKFRPAQKLLDQEALKEMGVQLLRDGDFLVLKGKYYSLQGFLYLDVEVSRLVTSNVRPTLDELDMFHKDQEITDELVKGCSLKAAEFSAGDVVEVVQNELTSLRGKVISVSEATDMVIVQPFHEALEEPVEFKSEELVKWFEPGDQVQVIAGQHKCNTGLVLKMEPDIVTIFTDSSALELTLRRRDVQLCSHQSTGLDRDGHFQIGDLVLIAPNQVGVVVHITQDKIRVLTMWNQEADFKPQQLQLKRSSLQAQALDTNGDTLKKDDDVYICDGPHTGRSGKIAHIYRRFVFLHTRNTNKSGSLIVCKCHHMHLAGIPCNKSKVAGVAPIMGAAAAFRSPFRTPGSATSKYTKNPALDAQNAFKEMRKTAEGKTIKVIKGPFKGSIATVKRLIDKVAQVELADRIVMVELGHMVVLQSDHEYLVGTSPKWNGCFFEQAFRGQPPTPSGNETPVHGFSTPINGLATPMYHSIGTPSYTGGFTPSHSGQQTPAWNPTASSFTYSPMYSPTAFPGHNDNSGSETPHPSWNSASDSRLYSPVHSPATPGYDMSGDCDTSSVYSPSCPLSPFDVPESENSADRSDSPAPPENKVIKLDNGVGEFSPCISIPSSLEHDVYTPRDAASTADYNPYGTPGPGMLSGAMITTPKLDEHWAVPGLLVNIKRSANSFTQGVCRGIPTAGVVKIETETGMISVPVDCISPVAPQFRDRVAIIRGNHVGVRGILLAIDQNEGIVSIDNVPQMIPMVHLCRLYQEPTDDDESVMSASPIPQLNK